MNVGKDAAAGDDQDFLLAVAVDQVVKRRAANVCPVPAAAAWPNHSCFLEVEHWAPGIAMGMRMVFG